jgi:hypothetical protein
MPFSTYRTRYERTANSEEAQERKRALIQFPVDECCPISTLKKSEAR